MGGYHLLILDTHESHHSESLELYYNEHKVITLYIPAYSSHILQPLDIRYFNPLKQVYGQ
jgi:hypothetical protein